MKTKACITHPEVRYDYTMSYSQLVETANYIEMLERYFHKHLIKDILHMVNSQSLMFLSDAAVSLQCHWTHTLINSLAFLNHTNQN